MYQCTFIKFLYKDAEKKKRLYKTLEKDITLPFAPDLSHEFTQDKWFSGKIERIVWDNAKQAFSIKVFDAIPKEGVSAELLFDISLKQGWMEQKNT